MRRKSPATVQKWVDSIPISSSTQSSPTTGEQSTPNAICSISQATASSTPHYDPNNDVLSAEEEAPMLSNRISEFVKDTTNVSPKDTQHSTKITEEPEELDVVSEESNILSEIKKASTESVDVRPVANTIWKGGPLLTKLNKSIDRLAEKASSAASSESNQKVGPTLTLLGKSKINEFYDKLNLNKKRFSQVKAKQINFRRSMENIQETAVASRSKNCCAETRPEVVGDIASGTGVAVVSDTMISCENPFMADDVFSSTRVDALELEGSIDPSLDDKLMLECYSGESLSNSPRTSDDGGYLSGTIKFDSVIECPRIQQKFLGNIGRSFSEHKPAPEESDVVQPVLKERNSYPNTSISVTDTSSDNKMMMETFGGSSLPVSPSARVAFGSSRQSSRHKGMLVRDSSFQSDSSRCSSVESLLVARKPNPEDILLNLGFGSSESEDVLSKIPKRFLRPSQVRGIDTEDFVRRQQVAMHLHEHSVLGYRGLVGNPHIAPSTIVAKIMERFQENDRNCYMGDDLIMSRPSSAPPTPGPTNPL